MNLKQNKIYSLQFYNGLMVVDIEKLPLKVISVNDAPHGDFKTQSIRDEFMGLKENEKANLIEIWTNFYGVWCRVKKENGEIADIEPKNLVLKI